MTIFERILDQGTVENAVVATLKNWMTTYLHEMERQTGRDPGVLPAPKGWTRKNMIDAWPEDQLPLIVVTCSGLAGMPTKNGDGRFRAPWAVGVAVVISASTEDATRNLAAVYGAAVRAILLQHQSLDSFPGARGVVWSDERSGEIASPDDSRTRAAVRSIFEVEFDDVTTLGAGPISPDDDIPDDWPEITDHEITINKEAINA